MKVWGVFDLLFVALVLACAFALAGVLAETAWTLITKVFKKWL